MERIEKNYTPNAIRVEKEDGISVLFDDWRFNLRSSNTEPLLRLNVESKGNKELLVTKVAELSSEILR